MAQTEHDSRPLAEQLDRCYPFGRVAASEEGRAAIQDSRDYAPWHRPLDAWWPGDAPDRPAPAPIRWAQYRERGRQLLHGSR